MGLKASWTVTAGVIPGVVEKEWSKQWLYTRELFDLDRQNSADGRDTNEFTAMMKDAADYMLRIQDPRVINWVHMEFMWY